MALHADRVIEDEIAKKFVKLEQRTFWETMTRISWFLVLMYAIFVTACVIIATNVRPK